MMNNNYLIKIIDIKRSDKTVAEIMITTPVQQSEDENEHFRTAQTYIDFFEKYFNDLDFKIKVKLNHDKLEKKYPQQSEDRHDVTRFNMLKSPFRTEAYKLKLMEFGKDCLFVVKEFHASVDYSSLDVIKELYKVFRDFDAQYNERFYMIIEKDTSEYLELNKSDTFYQHFKNLKYLYIIHWLGKFTTALKEVHFMMPPQPQVHMLQLVSVNKTEQNFVLHEENELENFLNQSFYSLILKYFNSKKNKPKDEDDLRNIENIYLLYENIGLLKKDSTDADKFELIQNKRDKIHVVANKMYNRIMEIIKEAHDSKDIKKEMKIYDKMLMKIAIIILHGINTKEKNNHGVLVDKFKYGKSVSFLFKLDTQNLVFKLRGKKRKSIEKEEMPIAHSYDDDEGGVEASYREMGSSIPKSPLTKKMKIDGGDRRRRRTRRRAAAAAK